MNKSAFGVELIASGIKVAEVTSLSGPSISGETIDVSNHDSDDRAREFVAGLIDGGEVSIEGNFTDTTDSLLDNIANGERIGIAVHYNGDAPKTVFSMQGLFTALSIDAPYDDKISFSGTIKASGLPAIGIKPKPIEGYTGALATSDITLIFSKEMSVTGLSETDFTYSIDGGSALAFNAIVLDSNNYLVNLTPAVDLTAGQIRVNYTAGTAKAADDEALDTFTNFKIKNKLT